MSDDRTPPQDAAAEQAVLGGMMVSKDAIADAIERLQPGDYYLPQHKRIHEAIVDLYAAGQPADVRTVAASIPPSELERCGGALYLMDCVSAVPTAANVAWYADIVADKAVRRRVIEVGTRAVQRGYGDTDTDTIVNEAQADILAVTRPGQATEGVQAGSLIAEALDRLELAERGGGTMGVPTGLADLDEFTRGMQPGQLWVVGARPSIGKTALAFGWALHAAIRGGIPAAFFSLEMSNTELVMRGIAHEARVSLQSMRSGRLNDDDWARIARRAADLDQVGLYLDDGGITVPELRAKARRMVQQHGVGLLVVDYLQLLTPAKRSDSRQQEVAEMSRQLKLLAKELQVPIVALSQLNRNAEMRQDKRPHLGDLRESGAVEQDADIVVLLHREEFYEPNSRPGEADLILAKHRNGPTDTITVTYQSFCTRFADRAHAWTPSAAAGAA